MVFCERCGGLRPEESLPNGLCLICWLEVPNPETWKPNKDSLHSNHTKEEK